MDNFDKIFQDKLNQINEADFEFKPAAWERFDTQREKSTENRKGIFYLWLKRNSAVAAIILLLLISNIFFAHQSVLTRYEVATISEQFQKLATDFESVQLERQVQKKEKSNEIESLNKDLITSKEAIISLNKEKEYISKAFQMQLEQAAILVSKINDTYKNSTNLIANSSKNTIKPSIFSDDNFIAATAIPNLSVTNGFKNSRIIDNIINDNYINTDEIDELGNRNLIANETEIVETEKSLNFLKTSLLDLKHAQNQQISFGNYQKIQIRIKKCLLRIN